MLAFVFCWSVFKCIQCNEWSLHSRYHTSDCYATAQVALSVRRGSEQVQRVSMRWDKPTERYIVNSPIETAGSISTLRLDYSAKHVSGTTTLRHRDTVTVYTHPWSYLGSKRVCCIHTPPPRIYAVRGCAVYTHHLPVSAIRECVGAAHRALYTAVLFGVY